jgi:very-short-patch-repair endonuclease
VKYNPAVVLAYFRDMGLPVPNTEHRFDENRRWRFDFSWYAEKVALEVEGGVWTGGKHGRGSGIVKDIEKYNAATTAGWRVLRVLPKELCTNATIAMLSTALALKR